MNKFIILCTYLLLCICIHKVESQITSNQIGSKHQLVPEIYVGKIVPNYLNYPATSARVGLALNYFIQKTDTADPVVKYYKKPLMGVQLAFHRLGNPAIFGNQVDLVPILNLPRRKGSFQFGLGIAYFTKNFRSNPENRVIGSTFTWSFQSIYFHNFKWNTSKDLRIGFGYLHASNGHTQLPNYGANSALLIIGITDKQGALFSSTSAERADRKYFISLNAGIGYHEFGGASKPPFGPKKAVYNSSIQFGIQFKGQFKWHMGFGGRKYMHYADSIDSNPALKELSVTPYNIYFTTGIEYLLYHVGISIDGGLNLYKPFFEHFSKRYETVDNWQYVTKKLFMSRVGLRLYLFNTAKNPKHNFYVAPYLNANFGQADYSEITLGYVMQL